LSIGYKYEAYYLKPPSMRKSFGESSEDFTDVKANPVIKWKTESVAFNKPIEEYKVANGWTIENHHSYIGGIVSKGDGTELNKKISLEKGLVAYYRFRGKG